jgi:hypothetical protein
VTTLTISNEPRQEQLTPNELTKHSLRKALAYPFEVLVSPLKAYKEIVQNPDARGLILVVGLVLLATVAVQLASASKIFLSLYTPPSSLLVTNLLIGYLLTALVGTGLSFVLQWLIFAGALLLFARLLGEKGSSPWRQFFTLIGYAFSVFIIRIGVSAVLISTLPPIDFQLATWPPPNASESLIASDRISNIWGPMFAYQAGVYFNLLIDVWLVILSTIALHTHREITWGKAAMVSVIAYFLLFTLRFFVGY